MKKLMNLVVLLVLLPLYSCNDASEVFEFQEEEVSLEQAANDLGLQLGVGTSVAGVEVLHGANENMDRVLKSLKRSSSSEWDLAQSATIRFTTKTGKVVTSIAIPHKANPHTMTTIVEANGETKAHVLDFSFFERNKTMSYQFNNTLFPYTQKIPWGDCFSNVLDSHVGDIITVLGVAGSIGCFACGLVAAFFLGVSALGCAG